MTSEERREIRYKRRKYKRYLNKVKRNNELGTIDDIISFHNMFYYGTKCCNGVRWKNSTQRFELHLFSGTAVRTRNVKNSVHKYKPNNHFTLRERGKIRPIDSPHINDRQIHKTITNKILYNIYSPLMIYDNGASQKGKGLHFSYKRLKMHLREHYKKYGSSGAIVFIDLKKFFPSAPRWYVKYRHKTLFMDDKIIKLLDGIIDHFNGDVGLPLGVEPSQLEMVSLPSSVDNYAKCQLSCKGYAHYADDYYIMVPSIDEGKKLLNILIEKLESIGLSVNKNKCSISLISKYFKYCKAKFKITESGKVLMHGCRDGMKRARRKINLFKSMIINGSMLIKNVTDWFITQVAYYKNYNDHKRVLKLNRIMYSMLRSVGGANT